MPEYKLVISKTAQKQLDKLPDNIAEPLINAIQGLAFDPRPHGCKKLKGRDGYRIRKGITGLSMMFTTMFSPLRSLPWDIERIFIE